MYSGFVLLRLKIRHWHGMDARRTTNSSGVTVIGTSKDGLGSRSSYLLYKISVALLDRLDVSTTYLSRDVINSESHVTTILARKEECQHWVSGGSELDCTSVWPYLERK